MTVDLTTLAPDDTPGNGSAFRDLETLTAGLADDVPVVLLPVRLETRFTQVEEPLDGREPHLGRLGDLFRTAAGAFGELAARDFGTTLEGLAGTDRRRFKHGTEDELYRFAGERIGTAGAVLEQARQAQRGSIAAGEQDRAALEEAARALRAALDGAGRSLARLRSGFHRTRLTARLAEVTALAREVLTTLTERTLPAAELRAALAAPTLPEVLAGRDRERRRALAGPGPGPRTGAAPRVVRAAAADAAAVASRVVTIPSHRLAEGAAARTALLAGIAAGAGDPADVERLAGLAASIPLLPGPWKRELLEAAGALGRRVARADVGPLLDAVRRIRSDDPALDTTIPGPELTVAVPAMTRVQDRLLVRLYPDDLHVDTHEEELTAAEQVAGMAFWRLTVAAADDAARRAAWRGLCAGRTTRRAAWVARTMQPDEQVPTAAVRQAAAALAALAVLDTALGRLDRGSGGSGRLPAARDAADRLWDVLREAGTLPAAPLRDLRERWGVTLSALRRLLRRRPLGTLDPRTADAAGQLRELAERISGRLPEIEVEPEPRLGFPEPGRRAGTWTRAAGSGVLPTRFLVVLVAGGVAVHVVAGRPVDPDLKLSVDPAGSDEFRLTDDGDLAVGDSIRWMTDYAEAHRKGMAVEVDITPPQAREGFDRVYVLGLCDPATPGADRLEGLLDNHHYGLSGLAVLATGTATNNTETVPAGMSSEDDPDAAFDRERGQPPFPVGPDPVGPDPVGPVPLAADSPDGLRLARALGVDPSRLAHLEGAGGTSIAEALTIGRVLHAATLGGWLEDHLCGLVPRAARDAVRAFALGHVAARGLVPAFRAGSQPYGVLPVTAWSSFAPDAAEELPPTAGAAELVRQQRFDDLLKRVLDTMLDDWRAAREAHVRTATDPPPGDARAHFLTVLGLQPVAVGAGYRIAVNVAGRHGPPALADDLRFGLPPSGGAPTGARFGPFALLERFDGILRDAFGAPRDVPLRDPATGLVHPLIDAVYQKIWTSRAYEIRLLRHVHRLTGPFVGSDPQAQLTALLAADPARLAADALAGVRAPSLLALLVRHAILAELRRAAAAVLLDRRLVPSEEQWDAIGSSAHFVVGYGVDPLTKWSFLLRELRALDGRVWFFPPGDPLVVAGGALIDHLKPGSADPVQPYTAAIAEHAADVATLSAVPADRLAVLLGEQLDLASHRLDAWVTGFAQRRLAAMRRAVPRGAHVGAYGWVENLKPSDGHPLADRVPASLQGDPSVPIRRDPAGQGFVHAPSVNHAVTAAILRSGYVSQHREADVENRMAVNLSSRRTRLALAMIDGVRAGNRLGALLGYRIERFLHEYHETAPGAPTLDALIGRLRVAYPSAAGVDGDVAPATAARLVCDGLAVVGAVQAWIDDDAPAGPSSRTAAETLLANPTGHPWGLDAGAVPERGSPLLEGFVRAIDHAADALDAVADLVVAEGVHQLALGNHARAAAVLSALAEGKAPPRPEVVDTPSTGTPLVHRVLLQLPPVEALPAGWAAIPATPRAVAGARLDAWLGLLLGDPDDLRLRLVHAGDGTDAGEVSVSELRLRAIDLLAILGPGLDTGLGEVAARALDARRPADVDDAAPPGGLRVDLGRRPGWGDGVRSLIELAPLLEALATLVGRGRAATAHDYAVAVPGAARGGDDGVDRGGLAAPVDAAHDALTGTGVALARLLAGDATLGEAVLDGDPAEFLHGLAGMDPPAWAARGTWRTALLDAAAFGITAALPPAEYPGRVPVRRQLRAAAETAFLEVVARRRRAADALAGSAAPSAYGAAARALFGEAFVLVPDAEPGNAEAVRTALGAGLASPMAVEGWLQGAGMVRDGAGALADVLALADAAGAPLPVPSVAQLPYDPLTPEPWLGDRVAPADDLGGRLSLVVYGALAAGPAALLVDEWTEIIPSAAETTGVAVHYDQPDASPPQCVLVAVPPRRPGRWTLGELVQTLHDTFELARVRAVELEHLAPTLYGQLLPAISGELVPNLAQNVPAASGDRVTLDFGAIG